MNTDDMTEADSDVTLLPEAGMSANGPVCVPETRARNVTMSPSASTQHSNSCRSPPDEIDREQLAADMLTTADAIRETLAADHHVRLALLANVVAMLGDLHNDAAFTTAADRTGRLVNEAMTTTTFVIKEGIKRDQLRVRAVKSQG